MIWVEGGWDIRPSDIHLSGLPRLERPLRRPASNFDSLVLCGNLTIIRMNDLEAFATAGPMHPATGPDWTWLDHTTLKIVKP